MKQIGIAACTLALLVAACDSSTAPVDPVDADDTALAEIDAAAGVLDRAARPGGPAAHALFDRIAGAIPGFAGFYFSGCDLVVVLTERRAADRATELLAPLLRRYHASIRRRCPDGGAIRIQDGDFTWTELSRFLDALRPVARQRGVGRLAISVPDNRIVVQVVSRDVAKRVSRFAESVGVAVRVLSFVGV